MALLRYLAVLQNFCPPIFHSHSNASKSPLATILPAAQPRHSSPWPAKHWEKMKSKLCFQSHVNHECFEASPTTKITKNYTLPETNSLQGRLLLGFRVGSNLFPTSFGSSHRSNGFLCLAWNVMGELDATTACGLQGWVVHHLRGHMDRWDRYVYVYVKYILYTYILLGKIKLKHIAYILYVNFKYGKY